MIVSIFGTGIDFSFSLYPQSAIFLLAATNFMKNKTPLPDFLKRQETGFLFRQLRVFSFSVNRQPHLLQMPQQ